MASENAMNDPVRQNGSMSWIFSTVATRLEKHDTVNPSPGKRTTSPPNHSNRFSVRVFQLFMCILSQLQWCQSDVFLMSLCKSPCSLPALWSCPLYLQYLWHGSHAVQDDEPRFGLHVSLPLQAHLYYNSPSQATCCPAVISLACSGHQTKQWRFTKISQ